MLLRFLLLGGLVLPLSAFAVISLPNDAQKTEHSYLATSMSLTEKPNYGKDFTHYDHINLNAPKGGTLHMAVPYRFDSTNPFIADGIALNSLTYATLMSSSVNQLSVQYPFLAESFELAHDNTWIIFTIRKGAFFSDGTPITAEDVVFSFYELMKKGNPQYKIMWGDVKEAKAIGSHQVKFSFKNGQNIELAFVIGSLPILSKAYWSPHDLSKITLDPYPTSGLYTFGDIKVGHSFTMVRQHNHWSVSLPIHKGRFNFDKVQYEIFDHSTIHEGFKSRKFDVRFENSSNAWATKYDFPAIKKNYVKKLIFPSQRVFGMQGFAFNLRKKLLQDRALREALILAYNFEWLNAHISYGLLTRCYSYFNNSKLAADSLPTKEELEILNPFKDQLPPEVFTTVYRPPSTSPPSSERKNLKKAASLLKKAGYSIQNDLLISPLTKTPVKFEVLSNYQLVSRQITPLSNSLKKLGIELTLRIVDTAQLIRRYNERDFDILIHNMPQSASPGNEQYNYFGSRAASIPGSENVIGIQSPVIDSIISKIVKAKTYEQLLPAVRSLDRVLLWGHYVIPQFYVPESRVAVWDVYGIPKQPALGLDLYSWWLDKDKTDKVPALK